jgi:hypothetical protein
MAGAGNAHLIFLGRLRFRRIPMKKTASTPGSNIASVPGSDMGIAISATPTVKDAAVFSMMAVSVEPNANAKSEFAIETWIDVLSAMVVLAGVIDHAAFVLG